MSPPPSPQLTGDLASMLKGLEQGLSLYDCGEKRFVFANEWAARLCGFQDPEEMLAVPAAELMRRYVFSDEHGAPIPYEQLPQIRALRGHTTRSQVLRTAEPATGRAWWTKLTAVPLRDEGGAVRRVAFLTKDITQQRRAARALRLLSDASALLAQSLDYAATLQALARRLVPELAEVCTIDVLEEDGHLTPISAHLDPAKQELAQRLRRRYPLHKDLPTGPGRVLRTGAPLHVARITEELQRAVTKDEEHLRLFQELGYRTAILAPMRARGRTVGVLGLVNHEGERTFDEADVALLSELAYRAAQAVDNARLYRQAQAALGRKDEEARANQTLSRIGASLASELDAERLMQRLCDEATDAIGARMGGFYARVGRGLHLVGAGLARELLERFEPPSPDSALFGATLKGETLRCADVRKDARYGQKAPHHGVPPGHPPVTSYLAVPVRTRAGEVVGGLFFGHPEPGAFTEAHERLVADIAAPASTAMENARLFQQLQAAERRSRDNEERLRLAIEAGKLGYFVVDARTLRATLSDRMREMLALPPGTREVPFATVRERTHPEEREAAEEESRRLLAGEGEGKLLHHRMLLPDGSVRWTEGYARLVRGADGRLEQVLAVRADVTERVRAQEQARKLAGEQAARAEAEASRQRIAALIDSISDPLFSLDREGRFRFVNRRAEELAGKPREQLVGSPLREAHPFSTSPALRDRCLLALAHGAPEEFEARLADGRDFEVRANPIDGGLAIYLRDLTTLKREQEARARQARYEALRADISTALSGEGTLPDILQRCGDAIVRHLGAGLVTVWTYNPRTRELEQQANAGRYTGVHPASPYARLPLGEELTGTIALEKKSFLTNDFANDPRTRSQAWARREGFVAYAGYPLLVGDQLIGMLAMFSRRPLPDDIVPALSAISVALAQGIQRRRAQQALAAHAAELARSNAELEHFAYVASHDLQEPLRMVASYTQLLSRRYRGKLDADADAFISYAVDGVRRMKRLISELTTYARVGTRGKELTATPLGGPLNAALANLRTAIEEAGAEVTVEPLPTVLGDEVQLEQLWQNLIGNALKFRGAASPKVHVGVTFRDHEWILSVKDNGIGIDRLYFDRIFVIFQRLHGKDEYEGTGIGLALCKKIVERHGGRIWVESTPGQGATFFFSLPRRSEPFRGERWSA